jgi:MFS family permease
MASRDIYSVLAVPNFRWLWIGSLGSSFAMNMQIIARGWFVYDLTSSAMDLAWVTLSFMLPSVLFSLYGGVLADRLPKRSLIVFAQTLNAAATLVMAWIIFSGNVVFWDFIWFGFFNGTVLALSMPARQAFVPELIPQPLIFTAMALNTTGWNLSRIVGPALAGLLIAWLAGGDKQSAFGVGIVYTVIASLYLASALTTLFVDRPGISTQEQRNGTYQEMREGLAYVFAHPRIFALLLLSIIPFLFGMPLNTLLPAFNQDVLGGHADSLGILVSAMGGGAIIGSMTMAAMGDMRRKGFWLLISSLGWAVATAFFGFSVNLTAALVAIALIGLISAWNMSLNRGLIQHAVDSHMRGRIMSIDMMFHGLMPLGVFPISWIAEGYGVGTALVVSGSAFAVLIGLSMMWSPAVRDMAQDKAAKPEASAN